MSFTQVPHSIFIHICSYIGRGIPVTCIASLEETCNSFHHMLSNRSLTSTNRLWIQFIQTVADPHQALDDGMLESLLSLYGSKELFKRLITLQCSECKKKTSYFWIGTGTRICDNCMTLVVGLPPQLVEPCFISIGRNERNNQKHKETQTIMSNMMMMSNNQNINDDNIDEYPDERKTSSLSSLLYYGNNDIDDDISMFSPPLSSLSSSELDSSMDMSYEYYYDSEEQQQQDDNDNDNNILYKEWMSLSDAWLYYGLDAIDMRDFIMLNVQISFPNSHKVMVNTQILNSNQYIKQKLHPKIIERKSCKNKNINIFNTTTSSHDRIKALNIHYDNISHYLIPVQSVLYKAMKKHGNIINIRQARFYMQQKLKVLHPNNSCLTCLFHHYYSNEIRTSLQSPLPTYNNQNNNNQNNNNQNNNNQNNIKKECNHKQSWYDILNRLSPESSMSLLPSIKACGYLRIVNTLFYNNTPNIIVQPSLNKSIDMVIDYNSPINSPICGIQVSPYIFPSLSSSYKDNNINSKNKSFVPTVVSTLEEALYLAEDGDCIGITQDIINNDEDDNDERILMVIERPIKILGISTIKDKKIHLHNQNNACILIEAPTILENLTITSGDPLLYSLIRKRVNSSKKNDNDDNDNDDDSNDDSDNNDNIHISYFSAIWARDDLLIKDCDISAKQGSNLVIESGGSIVISSCLRDSPLCGIALKDDGKLIHLQNSILSNNKGGPATFDIPLKVYEQNEIIR